jgi:hypothetical protein
VQVVVTIRRRSDGAGRIVEEIIRVSGYRQGRFLMDRPEGS